MKSLYITVLSLFGMLMLSGCAQDGGHGHHHHYHKHHIMSQDKKHPTYRKVHHRYQYDEQHYRHKSYKHHGRIHAHSPSYYGTKEAANTRISETKFYSEGYDAGCRTASTGGMYKNPKLHKDSQAYQMGWETGFNKCHYGRTHIDTDTAPFAYIPY